MNEHEEIKLSAMDQEVGEWSLHFCPYCRADHENKLSVLKLPDNNLYYNCLRASCGAKGFVGKRTPYLEDVRMSSKKKFVPKRWKYPLFPLKEGVLEILWDKYEITEHLAKSQGWKQTSQGELYSPIYSMSGEHVGDNIKKLNWEGDGTKTMAFWFKDVPRMHVPPILHNNKTCVIVEDLVSAAKMSTILPTIALMGTHLSTEAALAIKSRFSTMVFALDPDATQKAVKLAAEWSCLFYAQVALLDRDPKDTPYKELEERFEKWRVSS